MKKVFAFIIFLFLVSGLFIPPKANASDFWSTPLNISNPTNNPANTNYALVPAIATDSRNYLHSVWMECTSLSTCFNASNTPSPGIFYSYWNGVSWSSPLKLSKDLGNAEVPSIGATSDNKLHVVWDEDTTINQWNSKIYYSSSTDSATWSNPISISDPIDTNSSSYWSPRMAVDSNNNLHVVFNGIVPDPLTGSYMVGLYYTYSSDSGAHWSTPSLISGSFDFEQAQLIVDSSNNLHVVGSDQTTCYSWDCRAGVIYIKKPSGVALWDDPVNIKINYDAETSLARITSDSAGNIHVVYTISTTTGYSIIEYKKLPVGNIDSDWSSPTPLTTTGAKAYWYFPLTGISTDAKNNIYVAYGAYNQSGGIDAIYRKWVASEGWSNETFIRSTGYLEAPLIWKDKWDNQHFVWSEAPNSDGTGKWEYYYSVVPGAVGDYNPVSNFSLTFPTTNDTITIPNSSLDSSLTVSGQIGPLPESFDNTFTTIPRSYTFRPSGTTFINGQVAYSTINYTDNELLGADERNLKVYVWDSTLNNGKGGWSISYDTSVNTNSNQLTVTLPHFSVYGISSPKIETHFQNPTSNYSGSNIPLSYQLINLTNNLTASAPVLRTILDMTNIDPITGKPGTKSFLDNYSADLVDTNGKVLQTLKYTADNAGSLTYNTTNNIYNGAFSGAGLIGEDYTINTYLGTIKVGSFKFHFVPLPSVNFLPPLTATDVYTMQDGSTLPFKFQLTLNGTILMTQQNNVSVKVTGTDATTSTYIAANPLSLNTIFDTITGQYLANVQTKNMPLGNYNGQVNLGANLLGSIPFSIVNQGQAKGKSK